MKTNNVENKMMVELSSDRVFQHDVAEGLHSLMTDRYGFYHIYVRENEISVERQGYNTPALATVSFLTDSLSDEERKSAVATAYRYTFGKTGDLEKSMRAVLSNSSRGEISGARAFYHDFTGDMREEDVVLHISMLPASASSSYEVLENGYKVYKR